MARFEIGDDTIPYWWKFSAAESAAATFTQSTVSTGLSLERSVVALVHLIEIEFNASQIDDNLAASADEAVNVVITRDSKSSIVLFDDADCIFRTSFQVTRTSDAVASSLWTRLNPVQFHYPVPIIYAKAEIYLGIQATLSVAATVRGRLMYTLAKVPEKMFYRLATSLS